MCEEVEKKKDQALRLADEIEAQATSLGGLAQDVAESTRHVLDTVKPYRSLLSELPAASRTSAQWDHDINMLRGVQAGAAGIELSPTSINTFHATAYAMTSTSNTTIISIVRAGEVPLTPTMKVAISQLNEAMERRPLVDDARSHLRRLRLDRRAGKHRSPSDLLDEAKAAFDRPSRPENNPVSVLLPLRGCVQATVAELLRRRPGQEPAASIRDKVTLLGRHCARQGLKPDHFEGLATDMEAMIRALSGAKQAEMSRQQVSELFNQGLTFLNALLDSIDETLLR